ncbi:22422_t:CDS:1, partial [Racocetra persica]
ISPNPSLSDILPDPSFSDISPNPSFLINKHIKTRSYLIPKINKAKEIFSRDLALHIEESDSISSKEEMESFDSDYDNELELFDPNMDNEEDEYQNFGDNQIFAISNISLT